MNPKIDKYETGKKISSLIKKKGYSVEQIREQLDLASVQSVYHWLEGISLPSLDNLYVLSELLDTDIDEMLVGDKKKNITPYSIRETRCLYYA